MTIRRSVEQLGASQWASGGTRDVVKLTRPWQREMEITPATCVFERRPQKDVSTFDSKSGWRLIENTNTPFDFHRLLIPPDCWSVGKLRSLGGREQIEFALRLVDSVLHEAPSDLWIGVHIGYSAGQNHGHLHYHILKPIRTRPLSTIESAASGEELYSDDSLRVVLSGPRAGQCVLLPIKIAVRFAELTDSLANGLSWMIDLYNERFRSTEGLSPDYMVSIAVENREVRFACYVPILSQWGITEYLGLLENTPLILPWPHEKTRNHLLGLSCDKEDPGGRPPGSAGHD